MPFHAIPGLSSFSYSSIHLNYTDSIKADKPSPEISENMMKCACCAKVTALLAILQVQSF